MQIKNECLHLVLTLRENGRDKVYRFDSLTKDGIQELMSKGIDMTDYLEPTKDKRKNKSNGRVRPIQDTMDEQKGDNEDLSI